MKKKTKGDTPIRQLSSKSKSGLGSAARKKAMTNPGKPNTHNKSDLWTAKTVGEKLGLSHHKVRNLLQSVPVAGKASCNPRANVYDSRLVVKAFEDGIQRKKARKWSKEWYEIERLKRQIEKLDHELDVMKSQYLPIEQAQLGYLAQVLATRKHWLEMVEKMPPLLAGLPPSSMQVKLKDYVNQVFEKFRNHKFDADKMKLATS